jgi:hypothetical protein
MIRTDRRLGKVNDPDWEGSEALTALRDSLAAYEQHARTSFLKWADMNSELSSPPPSTDPSTTSVVDPADLESAAGLLARLDSADASRL